jgi:hypothetical protein
MLRSRSRDRQLDRNPPTLRFHDAIPALSAGHPNDVLHFPPTTVRYVAVRITASTDAQPPMLDEITAG